LNRPIRRSSARAAKRRALAAAPPLDPASCAAVKKAIKPPRERYLRFVVQLRNRRFIGLFRSSELVETPDLLPSVASALRSQYEWFNRHMHVPRGLPKGAVCWFRSDAIAHLEKVRDIAEVYRLAGYQVWMHATTTPGKIVYSDAMQIAAVPKKETRWTVSAW
jgi:hypothetical protein